MAHTLHLAKIKPISTKRGDVLLSANRIAFVSVIGCLNTSIGNRTVT